MGDCQVELQYKHIFNKNCHMHTLVAVLWYCYVFYEYRYSTPVSVRIPNTGIGLGASPVLGLTHFANFFFLLVLIKTHRHKYYKYRESRMILLSQGVRERVAILNHLPPREDWVTPWRSGLLLRKHRPDIFTGFLLVSRGGGGRVRGGGSEGVKTNLHRMSGRKGMP